MNKTIFMDRLKELLSDITEAEREELGSVAKGE